MDEWLINNLLLELHEFYTKETLDHNHAGSVWHGVALSVSGAGISPGGNFCRNERMPERTIGIGEIAIYPS